MDRVEVYANINRQRQQVSRPWFVYLVASLPVIFVMLVMMFVCYKLVEGFLTEGIEIGNVIGLAIMLPSISIPYLILRHYWKAYQVVKILPTSSLLQLLAENGVIHHGQILKISKAKDGQHKIEFYFHVNDGTTIRGEYYTRHNIEHLWNNDIITIATYGFMMVLL